MKSNTDWFMESKWGVFTHYLASPETSAKNWNNRVNKFDVYRLAQQLECIGTKYYFITIGQNSGHYCSPNETYDKLVEIKPSKCSERDLIADIHATLNLKGIKLLVYLPSGAPAADLTAVEKLNWEWGYEGGWTSGGTKRTGKRLAEFQEKWEAVIREWSIRWGSKVSGWWIDGCYFSDEMYRHPEPPNFDSFAKALKAGNPNSIIAFNPGVVVPVISLTECEDYTAGEISDAFPVCPGRWVNGAQYHILSYLGEYWGRGEPRFPNEFVLGYTKHVNSKGGVVTWDVPISENGLIPQMFIDQLMVLKNHA
ncbi:MAG: alpha-L-fucosidase [bacterium]